MNLFALRLGEESYLKKSDAFRVWGRILQGHRPFLSIEITRECPLRCPGCYAYEPEHLNHHGPLIAVSDYVGQQLVDKVLALVERHAPVHLSIVGGEPLVRFRELDRLLPRLSEMGVEVQVVTSAVREIPRAWNRIKGLHLVVSIDGLRAEHDVRRAPATYDRILKSISGHSITVHCTVTSQMAQRPDGFKEFLSFWSERVEVNKIWFSLFTPQKEAQGKEILSLNERKQVLRELAGLRAQFAKLHLPDVVIDGYLHPPRSPAECLFAKATLNLTADLQSRISPCQFGGTPDCSQCGCIASAGLKAVGDYRLMGFVPLRSIINVSEQIGKGANRAFGRRVD